MHKLSIAALLVAALALSSPSLAQVSVEAGAGGNVSASAGGVDVNAGTSASAGAGGSSGSSGVDAGASASAGGGGNGNGGSGSGGASASASGEAGNASSAASASSSATGGSNAADEKNCTNLDAGMVSTGAIDEASLAGVTSITVFSTLDCSGLESLTGLDAGAQAALGGNEMVAKAITDAGYQGQQVVGYALDGTSLTVYVKK